MPLQKASVSQIVTRQAAVILTPITFAVDFHENSHGLFSVVPIFLLVEMALLPSVEDRSFTFGYIVP